MSDSSIRSYALYCSMQGRYVPRDEDHVTSVPLASFEETGESDEYGGQKLVTIEDESNEARGIPPGVILTCKVCGAPLRSVEVRGGVPS